LGFHISLSASDIETLARGETDIPSRRLVLLPAGNTAQGRWALESAKKTALADIVDIFVYPTGVHVPCHRRETGVVPARSFRRG
jgi:hypothetical protein